MLTHLSMQNFKSWRHTGDVPLSSLTGLFGTNSSGKTSLLQLLLMLKQTTESADRNAVLDLGDQQSTVELGTFQDLLYEHDPERSLKWAISWSLNHELQVLDPDQRGRVLFRGSHMTHSCEVSARGSGSPARMSIQEMSYGLDGANFAMRLRPSDGKYGLHESAKGFQFRRVQGRAWPLPAPAKCYGFPDQVRAYYQNAGFLSDLEFEFEQLFRRLYYLGPLRERPQREYSYAGSSPADMGPRGERVIEALLSSRDADVRYSLGRGIPRKTLEELVAWWLRELDLIDSFEVRPVAEGSKLHQVWVKRHPRAKEVLITDVGFGISQILPVIALCYYVPEGSVVLLEQPEIHLHPRVQAGLADVFIDAIKLRRIQIILESHSEHLVKRLQRRIAEEKFDSVDAALYFCSIKKGESDIERLKVDMFGNIENWPDGFFGDEFGEIAAMQDAIFHRKRVSKT